MKINTITGTTNIGEDNAQSEVVSPVVVNNDTPNNTSTLLNEMVNVVQNDQNEEDITAYLSKLITSLYQKLV